MLKWTSKRNCNINLKIAIFSFKNAQEIKVAFYCVVNTNSNKMFKTGEKSCVTALEDTALVSRDGKSCLSYEFHLHKQIFNIDAWMFHQKVVHFSELCGILEECIRKKKSFYILIIKTIEI